MQDFLRDLLPNAAWDGIKWLFALLLLPLGAYLQRWIALRLRLPLGLVIAPRKPNELTRGQAAIRLTLSQIRGFFSFIGLLAVLFCIAATMHDAAPLPIWKHIAGWIAIVLAWMIWGIAFAPDRPEQTDDEKAFDKQHPHTVKPLQIGAPIIFLLFWGAIFYSLAFIIYA